jgi:hypothetical protein
MNPRRQAAILAAQKVRVKTDPVLTPEAPKLTAEQRREMYAPKPATSAPQQLQGGQWVEAWKTTTRLTYGLTAFTALIFGGIIAGESKKGLKP